MLSALRPKTLPPSRLVTTEGTVFSLLSDYLTLTKPAVIVLLLITALGGMFVAAGGPPPFPLLAAVMVGGALAAGGANALNHYCDRDIDALMLRTRRRPVAGHRIAPWKALTLGILLNLIALGVLLTGVNLLSALLALSASLFYVLVYTCWLKRLTPQNIVIGGAAGAVPPLVGWAAVTGGLDLPAWYLFAIVFFWTPPHFWALALLIADDYARAGVPMLPVVGGVAQTARSIMLYSVALVAVTILFFTTGAVGWLYLVVVIGLGAHLLLQARRLHLSQGTQGARPLYRYSLLYLAALFAALMLDSAFGLGQPPFP